MLKLTFWGKYFFAMYLKTTQRKELMAAQFSLPNSGGFFSSFFSNEIEPPLAKQ